MSLREKETHKLEIAIKFIDILTVVYKRKIEEKYEIG